MIGISRDRWKQDEKKDDMKVSAFHDAGFLKLATGLTKASPR